MRFLLVLFTTVVTLACAHPFSRIQPGMNSTEVRGTTGDVAPTNVVPWGASAQSWYYGGDRCILIVDDKVVAKYSPDDAPTGTTEAICVPPGAQPAPAPAPVPAPAPAPPPTEGSAP